MAKELLKDYNSKQLDQDSTPLTSVIDFDNQDIFVARSKELKIIEHYFLISNLLVLSGSMQGVGKSLLAQRYFAQNKEKFDHYGYVTIHNNFRQSFSDALKDALDLKLEYLENRFIESINKLSQLNGRILLIIDNSKEPAIAQDRLNLILSLTNKNFKILLVSQEPIENLRNYSVNPLDTQSSVELFLHYYPTKNIKKVQTIVEYCNRHTLFIVLFAKMLFAQNIELDSVLTMFRKGELQALKTKDSVKNIHHNLNLLLKQNPLEYKYQLLLKRLVLLPSKEINTKLLSTILSKEDDHVEEKMEYLATLGLLNRQGGHYQMNAIVREFIQNYQTPTIEEATIVINFFTQLIHNSHDKETIQKAKEYFIYLKEIELYVTKFPVKNVIIQNFLGSLGNIYYHLKEYHKASDTVQKSLEMQEASKSTNPLLLAQNYNDLGLIYKSTKDYGRAVMYLKKGLDLRLKVLNEKHLDLSFSYNNIGLVHYLNSNYDEALKFFDKALTIKELHLSKYNMDRSNIYNNVALTYQALHEHKKAMLYFEKAIKVREHLLGKEHPDTAQLYSNLGVLYQDMHNYSKALQLIRASISINDHYYGSNHKSNITNFNKLAMLYIHRGHNEEAQRYFERVVEIKRSIVVPYHKDNAIACNNLGVFYLLEQQYDQAILLFRKALRILKSIVREDNIDEIKIRYALATAYYFQHNYQSSITLFKEVLQVEIATLGINHPQTIATYNALANAYYRDTVEDEAFIMYKNSLEFSKELEGKHKLLRALSHHNIAVLDFNLGKYKEALGSMQKALKIYQKFLTSDDIQLLEAQNRFKTMQAVFQKVEKNLPLENLSRLEIDFCMHSKNIYDMFIIDSYARS